MFSGVLGIRTCRIRRVIGGARPPLMRPPDCRMVIMSHRSHCSIAVPYSTRHPRPSSWLPPSSCPSECSSEPNESASLYWDPPCTWTCHPEKASLFESILPRTHQVVLVIRTFSGIFPWFPSFLGTFFFPSFVSQSLSAGGLCNSRNHG